MRYVLAPLAVLSLILATGCEERPNMRAVPDRLGHAAGPDSNQGDLANSPVAGPNEQWYTMQKGENLAAVAKKFNVELKWLVRRNQIDEDKAKKVGPGFNLIVPRK